MNHCFFCKNEAINTYSKISLCNYYICLSCWFDIPNHIPNMQKWKYVQLMGDKI